MGSAMHLMTAGVRALRKSRPKTRSAEGDDDLALVRGLIIAVPLSLVLWVAIIWAVIHFFI